jgi:hypothetical protein
MGDSLLLSKESSLVFPHLLGQINLESELKAEEEETSRRRRKDHAAAKHQTRQPPSC